MKIILLNFRSFALLAVLLLPLCVVLAEGPESLLHSEMEAINHNFRLVKRQYADPAQKVSTLDLVAGMQQHAEAARKLTPPKADKISGDDKTKYVDTFHKDLDALIKEIGALKQAIVVGKTDVAKAELDKIAQLKDSSHKELGVGEGGKHQHPPPGQ